MTNKLKMTIKDLREMLDETDFAESMEVTTLELLCFGVNFPDIELFETYLSEMAIAELNTEFAEFENSRVILEV